MRITKVILLALLLCAVAIPLWAQGTYTAASCNSNDVNAVINGPTHKAVDGDTINIPAGTCAWAKGITVPSNIGITIIGTGTPNSGAETVGPNASCSATAITISSGMAITMKPTYGNSTARISCMSLTRGGSSSGIALLGTCTTSGCPNIRIDNVGFHNWVGNSNSGNAYGVNAVSSAFGVIDHNSITGGSDYTQLVQFGHGSYLGVGAYGDNSWHLAEDYGSANFLFMENNSFNQAGCCENESGFIESFRAGDNGGGRVVIRFNQFTDGVSFSNAALAFHGTDSSGRTRSSRAFEFYNNSYTCPPGGYCNNVIGTRGGNGLAWGNTINETNAPTKHFLEMTNYRVFGSPNPAFAVCDGSTSYDINDGVTYFSGKISSVRGVESAYVLTPSCSPSCGWTNNQWSPVGAPYSVHDVTQTTGAEITSSDTNTLTINSGYGGPGSWTPRSGDTIQILRATACIDSAGGRGAGVLYNATNPATPLVSSAQAAIPTYAWNNPVIGGSITLLLSDTLRVIRNRDFYTENLNQSAQSSPTNPFDGTTTIGMGHGILANRPTTCTTGVGYWATDQGNWNQGGIGGQGQLYLCTAKNTWTLYYTPYTYPHPLTQSQNDPPPPPPSNLEAIPQ